MGALLRPLVCSSCFRISDAVEGVVCPQVGCSGTMRAPLVHHCSGAAIEGGEGIVTTSCGEHSQATMVAADGFTLERGEVATTNPDAVTCPACRVATGQSPIALPSEARGNVRPLRPPFPPGIPVRIPASTGSAVGSIRGVPRAQDWPSPQPSEAERADARRQMRAHQVVDMARELVVRGGRSVEEAFKLAREFVREAEVEILTTPKDDAS